MCTDANTLPDQRPRGLKTGQPQGKRHGSRASDVAGTVSACTSWLPLGSAGRGEVGRAEPPTHPSPAGKLSSNPLLALKGTSRTLQARPWEENSLARPYTRAAALPSAVAGGRRMPPLFCLVSGSKLNTRAVCLQQAHPGLPKPGGTGVPSTVPLWLESLQPSAPGVGRTTTAARGTCPAVRGPAGPRRAPSASPAPHGIHPTVRGPAGPRRASSASPAPHGTRPAVTGPGGPRGAPPAAPAPSPAPSSPEGCRAAVGQDGRPGSSM